MSTSLMPIPKVQFFTDGGLPLAGGLIYTYMPGTTTPKASYTDSTGLTANANPVVLDSAGRASIWLSGFYDIAVYTSAGVLVYTVGNVSSMSASATTNNQWIIQDLALTFVGATQFTVPGDQTATFPAGTRILATVTAGTIIGTVTSSSAGGGPVITTVNCIWDAGALDAGLSAIYTGILTTVLGSLPIQPVLVKTASYVLTITDINKIVVMNATTAQAFTLPAANAVPSGAWYRIKNVGTGLLTVTGTVSGYINPVLTTGEESLIFSDGSAWYGTAKIGAPIGSGLTWFTETPPDNYLERDGSSLLRASYPELFAVIGTMYGAVDATHFNLPASSGRVERAWDHGAGVDPDAATRTDRGDGTTGDHVGTKQTGTNESHTHTGSTSSPGNHTHTFTTYSQGDGVSITRGSSGGGDAATRATDGGGNHNHTFTSDAAGGNETRMVNEYVMKCIKYQEG